MAIIESLISDVIAEQTAILEGVQHSTTEASRRAAAYAALATRLEAERTAVQKCFEYNRREKILLYASANSVLDEAIRVGDVVLAAIAMRVIEVAHSKTVFVGGIEEE